MNNNLINPEDKFWSKNQDGKISLNNFKFKRFLEMHNFFKNRPNENSSFNIIKKNGIFLEIQDETDIKDFVLNYVLDNELGEDIFRTTKLNTCTITFFKIRPVIDYVFSKLLQNPNYLRNDS